MASSDTRTQQYLGIAANGSRADLPGETCCETRTQTLTREVAERVIGLDEEVQELKNNPDVVDIVETYQDLEDYDTSTLTDKDIIRVLQDSTHSGNSTYYRWNSATEEFDFVGEISGGSNIIELTREHYNFPVDNPQGIAVWLLDPNYIYINKTEDLSFIPDGTTISYVHELEGIFLVTPTQDYQNRCSVIYFSCDGEQSLGTKWGIGTYTTYNKVTGELVDSGAFLTDKQIGQTTGQNTNMMMSQKAITDALSALEARVAALEGN